VDDLETLLDNRRGSSGTANLSAKEFKELLNKITGDKVCIDTVAKSSLVLERTPNLSVYGSLCV
jgi:hypothetical protein